MDKNHKILIQFVLEQAEAQPLERRVAIYRGLAAISETSSNPPSYSYSHG